MLSPTPAHAVDVDYAVHAEGAAAHLVGDRKVHQFGWGAGGLFAGELTLGDHIGIELPIGGVVLAAGTAEPGLAASGMGYSMFALPGIRVRPFGRGTAGDPLSSSGLWFAGGGGLAVTGEILRPAIDARLGFDLFANGYFRFGPSLGYVQIIDTMSLVLPEDARVLMFGLHAAIEPTITVARVLSDDRDGDGIRDAIDQCPDDAEDPDGFEDDDGCPDLDDDGDKIPDLTDKCPMKAEDKDGFEDDDGCPDPDNDKDAILDGDDDCPDEAEDKDGFEDDDGCPDLDNDGDGSLDSVDQCPDEAETKNGYADDDGCPDEEKVRVVGDEIVLDQKIFFGVNTAKIAFKSLGLVKRLATLLNDNPTYATVHVQGHADDTGADDYNKTLSIRRGDSVRRQLIRFGVASDRLVVEGYGEDRPDDPKRSTYARNKNRRVEFLILRRRKVRPDGTTAGTARPQ